MEWRAVVGYEGLYEVSRSGIVRRACNAKTGGHKKGKLVRINIHRNGYLSVVLCKDNVIKTQMLHRVVAFAFIHNSKPTIKNEVNHKNGIKSDCHCENLEWMSRTENCRHSYDVLGRKAARGMSAGLSKLTDSDVVAIRELHATGKYLQREIAVKFKITAKQVSVIVNRVQWAHI